MVLGKNYLVLTHHLKTRLQVFKFVKTKANQANIDKIKFNCTSCQDKNYVFDFNDSKERFISGGGC